MELNISLLVGLKNNLDYTQNFYQTTRELYPTAEICFTSYGSTDGTHEWLGSLNDPNLKFFISDENKTFSDIGMVTDAVFSDFNKDGKTDLIVVGEWMAITIFENTN